MGSFNVACGISNLVINENDRVGFVLLGESRLDCIKGGTYYTGNNDLFKPFLPAVYGRYDDYGKISNIEPSVTVDVIENIFRRDIETVLNCITDMEDVYGKYGRLHNAYFKGDQLWDDYNASFPERLKRLGFAQLAAEPQNPAVTEFAIGSFRLVFKYDETTRSTPSWHVFKGTNGIFVTSFYSNHISEVMQKFSEATACYPGYDPADYRIIHLLRGLSGMFFLAPVYEEMQNTEFEAPFSSFLSYAQERWDNVAKEMDKTEGDDFLDDFAVADDLSSILRDTSFPAGYRNELRAYKDGYELLEMVTLSSMMLMLNRMFMPSYCGTQHGSDAFSRKLNAVTDAILKTRYEEEE